MEKTTLVEHVGAFNAACPTRLILNRIADKWTVLVMILLESETKRFSQLQGEIGDISQKILTQTLRGLERDGLVTRTVYATVPPIPSPRLGTRLKTYFTRLKLGHKRILMRCKLRKIITSNYIQI